MDLAEVHKVEVPASGLAKRYEASAVMVDGLTKVNQKEHREDPRVGSPRLEALCFSSW